MVQKSIDDTSRVSDRQRDIDAWNEKIAAVANTHDF